MSMHIEGRDDDQNSGQGVKGGSNGPSAGLIGFIVLAVVTVLFVVQNSEKTTIHFLGFEVESRTWVALLVAIALGVVLDRLFGMWWRRRRARRRRD